MTEIIPLKMDRACVGQYVHYSEHSFQYTSQHVLVRQQSSTATAATTHPKKVLRSTNRNQGHLALRFLSKRSVTVGRLEKLDVDDCYLLSY
jgi:hypothetical protein